jgi:hypothetical protein
MLARVHVLHHRRLSKKGFIYHRPYFWATGFWVPVLFEFDEGFRDDAVDGGGTREGNEGLIMLRMRYEKRRAENYLCYFSHYANGSSSIHQLYVVLCHDLSEGPSGCEMDL